MIMNSFFPEIFNFCPQSIPFSIKKKTKGLLEIHDWTGFNRVHTTPNKSVFVVRKMSALWVLWWRIFFLAWTRFCVKETWRIFTLLFLWLTLLQSYNHTPSHINQGGFYELYEKKLCVGVLFLPAFLFDMMSLLKSLYR